MNAKDPENKPLKNHFTIFVYPFIHHFGEIIATAQQLTLYKRWSPWICRLPTSEALEAAFDDSYFFLPAPRQLLFPDFSGIPNSPESETILAGLLKTCEKPGSKTTVPKADISLHDDLSFHLTLRQQETDMIRSFTLNVAQKNYLEQGKIEWVDLFLFTQRIGFLAIMIEITKEALSIADLINFNSYFRSVIRPSRDIEVGQLSVNKRKEIDSNEKLVEYLLDGLVAKSGKDYLASSEGQVYGERFNTYSYACMDATTDLELFQKQDPPFQTVLDRILYEYATSSPWRSSVTKNGTLVPSQRFVRDLFSKYEFSLWQSWTGMFLRDAAVFLSIIPNKFTLEALRHNIQSDYFNLYMFSLYQKFRLYGFAKELVREDDNPRKTLKSTRNLLDQFVAFRNRFWVSEVTKKPQGHEMYHKYRKGLATEELFEAVHGEIDDLSAYYETRISRSTNMVLNFLTFVATPLATITGLFLLTKPETKTNWSAFIVILAGVYALFILGSVAWRSILKQ